MVDELITKIQDLTKTKILEFETLGTSPTGSKYKVVADNNRAWFVKKSSSDIIDSEHDGLEALSNFPWVVLPKVVCKGSNFLVTEFIQPETPTSVFWENLAKVMARLHETESPVVGYEKDNFIGFNRQKNKPPVDRFKRKTAWADFFCAYRLNFQFELAIQNGLMTSMFEACFLMATSKIHQILSEVDEAPCPLHGDLWSGNIICGKNQKPYIIDPAFYYGHRESDIAMTHLFGGFSPEFYKKYTELLPLKPGHEQRKDIYNLYHLMNHWNLFGENYYQQAIDVILKFR